MGLRDFLDDGREGASLTMSRRGRVSRLLAMSMVGGLLAANFGWPVAAAWMAANLSLEAWLLVLQVRFKPRPDGRTSLLIRLGPPAAFSTLWSVMAALSWIHGTPAMQFAALVILFGLLVEGLKYAVVSRSALLAMMPGPFTALLLAPTVFGGFTGWERVVVIVILVSLGAYVLEATRQLRASALALEKAQAQADEASQAKSAFVAMMSHELRTPMNGVLGIAHALGQTKLDARQAAYLEMIVQSGDGLMTILNDILDLSKIEAWKLELEVVAFDIRRLSGQLHLVCSETARLKGVELALEIDPETPIWLAGDPMRVRQILLNLVSNALKFTDAGRVAVRIAPDAAGGVIVTVSDTGVGLSLDQQTRMFNPFIQGDRSTSRRHGGTGLGLTICRQLAELMGGRITVESVPRQGSVFTVYLPLAAVEPPTLAGLAGATLDLTHARVLVVDDNPINLTVVRAILEAAQAVIATASDGRKALARLRVEDFDVVLMDVHMPDMDGIEAVRRIRAGEAGRVDIPIMALTADAMACEAERLVRLGFDDAHAKPIQPAGLLEAVALLRQAGRQIEIEDVPRLRRVH